MSVARFKVEFYDKIAEKEYLSLDGSVRAMVDKGIARLAPMKLASRFRVFLQVVRNLSFVLMAFA